MGKFLKIWLALLAFIMAISACYFLCNRVNIGRYQYHSDSTSKYKYVLDTKTGAMYQTVCRKFNNGLDDSISIDCKSNALQLMPIINYEKI